MRKRVSLFISPRHAIDDVPTHTCPLILRAMHSTLASV